MSRFGFKSEVGRNLRTQPFELLKFLFQLLPGVLLTLQLLLQVADVSLAGQLALACHLRSITFDRNASSCLVQRVNFIVKCLFTLLFLVHLFQVSFSEFIIFRLVLFDNFLNFIQLFLIHLFDRLHELFLGMKAVSSLGGCLLGSPGPLALDDAALDTGHVLVEALELWLIGGFAPAAHVGGFGSDGSVVPALQF